MPAREHRPPQCSTPRRHAMFHTVAARLVRHHGRSRSGMTRHHLKYRDVVRLFKLSRFSGGLHAGTGQGFARPQCPDGRTGGFAL